MHQTFRHVATHTHTSQSYAHIDFDEASNSHVICFRPLWTTIMYISVGLQMSSHQTRLGNSYIKPSIVHICQHYQATICSNTCYLSLSLYIYIYIIYVHIHIRIYIYIHIIYVYIYTHIHIHIYTHVCVYIYIYDYVSKGLLFRLWGLTFTPCGSPRCDSNRCS